MASVAASIHYPFRMGGLSPEGRAALSAGLNRWSGRFRLASNKDRSLVSVAYSFTAHCGPTECDPGAVRTVALFMYALMYFNSCVSEGHLAEAVATFEEGLYSGRGDCQVSKVGAELGRRVARHGNERDRQAFLVELHRCLQTFVGESEARQPPSLSRYEVQRHLSISVQPFLELWKLANGTSWPTHNSMAVPVAHAEHLCREIHFLANDLCSTQRDRRLGQGNLVAIMARELSVSERQAARQVKQRHADRVQELSTVLTDLRRKSEPSLGWYLNLMEGCIWGNVLAMRELSHRYAT